MKHLGWDQADACAWEIIEIDLPGGSPDEEKLHAICRDLLSNPVIEDYTFDIAER